MFYLNLDEVIIFCNNTHSISCGYAGDDIPRHTYPTIFNQVSQEEFYIGQQATFKNDLFSTNPIEYGIIKDFDAMEKIWDSNFSLLKKNSKGMNIFMNEELGNSRKNKQKIFEIMFEKYELSSLGMEKSPILNLVANDFRENRGPLNGIVLDIGHSKITSSFIFEGCLPINGSKISYFGGRDISEFIKKKQDFGNIPIDEIKEKCKVYNCFEDSIMAESEKHYFQNNGDFRMAGEVLSAPELLFTPSLFPKIANESSIIELIRHSLKHIGAHDNKTRSQVKKTIVVTGGSSAFKSLENRLNYELNKYETGKDVIEVSIRPPNNQQFFGASVFTNFRTPYSQEVVSSETYKEFGKTERSVGFHFINEPVVNLCTRRDPFLFQKHILTIKSVDMQFQFA